MISRPRLRPIFSLFFLCALTLLGAPQILHAQQSEAASGEDVAIAFFKTGDTNPDFDLWAKQSKDYKVAAPAIASEALFNEKQRLILKWRDYDPEESVLNVVGRVNVELKSVMTKSGEEQYWMYMMFPDGEVTYFPYKFLDYRIAVIPQQIESLMIQSLQKEQYDLIRANFGGGPGGLAFLSLQLKPAKAYMQQPYVIDGKEQWALLCDIATMSLHSHKTKQAMWNFGADWYVSPVSEELRDLYQKQDESGGSQSGPSVP